jgi:hypothetical protein
VEVVIVLVAVIVLAIGSTLFWGHHAGRAREELGGTYEEGFAWGALGGFWGLWRARTPPPNRALIDPRTGPMHCSACGGQLTPGEVHSCGPERPTRPPAAEDQADRLRQLVEMRDAGHVSAEEFEHKRQEILDRL